MAGPLLLDIIIPVYNEGPNIVATLAALASEVRSRYRVLICYDFEGDDTLPAVKAHQQACPQQEVAFVRNTGRGAHAAVMSGFRASTAPIVVVYPADDDFNAALIDPMIGLVQAGSDIVCASRFMPGGTMQGCPWLKATLVRTAAFTLHHLARLPTRDPTSGFRMFSRRVIDTIVVESDRGFTYSIELLVKAHRLGWRISELPAKWFERTQGTSRFRVLSWLPAYLRWYRYAFATTYLRRSPSTVRLRDAAA
jgi:glycosyltransferase involved in cell wall biosynthesis